MELINVIGFYLNEDDILNEHPHDPQNESELLRRLEGFFEEMVATRQAAWEQLDLLDKLIQAGSGSADTMKKA